MIYYDSFDSIYILLNAEGSKLYHIPIPIMAIFTMIFHGKLVVLDLSVLFQMSM
jgi:hypothetical protein